MVGTIKKQIFDFFKNLFSSQFQKVADIIKYCDYFLLNF